MTKVFLIEDEAKKEINSLEAIDILNQWPGGARPYLDLLTTQNAIYAMGIGISYEGSYPHSWKVS